MLSLGPLSGRSSARGSCGPASSASRVGAAVPAHAARLLQGPLDGYFSTATDKALRRYQRQVHLVADGAVEPKTVAALVLQNRVPVRPRRVSVSLSRSYVVKPGDSLTAIARRFHVSLGRLARANRLDPKRFLIIGTKLRIPTYTLASSTSSAPPATPTEVHERLDYWAGRYGISPQLLRALSLEQTAGYARTIHGDSCA